MTDTVLMIFTEDNRLVLEKSKKGPRPAAVKHFRDPVKHLGARYKLDVVLDDVITLPIHKVKMKFARTTSTPNHPGLKVYESLEQYLEEVEYEKRAYPLRCAGWQSAAFSFLKKEE